MVTQQHIARAAGVSRSAVKAAFNPDPRVRLRAETQSRILRAARELGYVPNHAARRLARFNVRNPSRPFEHVGFMYVSADGSYVDPAGVAMMHGAARQLSVLGACIMFVPTEPDGWERLQRMVRSRLIDGWLLSGAVDDAAVHRLESLGVPHVVVGDHYSRQAVHAVNVDYVGAGRMAVDYFWQLGHRRIGFFGGTLQLAYQTQLLAGFRARLGELGTELDERLVVGEQVNRWLAKLSDPPTAIFCTESAAGLRHASQPILPSQIDVLACEVGLPATTSSAGAPVAGVARIFWPMEDVGREGARLLRKVVSDPQSAACDLRIPATLVTSR